MAEHECNAHCHQIERELVLLQTAILIRLILDGDDTAIQAILRALGVDKAA